MKRAASPRLTSGGRSPCFDAKAPNAAMLIAVATDRIDATRMAVVDIIPEAIWLSVNATPLHLSCQPAAFSRRFWLQFAAVSRCGWLHRRRLRAGWKVSLSTVSVYSISIRPVGRRLRPPCPPEQDTA
jgi:hypothetical protein